MTKIHKNLQISLMNFSMNKMSTENLLDRGNALKQHLKGT